MTTAASGTRRSRAGRDRSSRNARWLNLLVVKEVLPRLPRIIDSRSLSRGKRALGTRLGSSAGLLGRRLFPQSDLSHFHCLRQTRIFLCSFVGRQYRLHPHQHAFSFEYDPVGGAVDRLGNGGDLARHLVGTANAMIQERGRICALAEILKETGDGPTLVM